MLSHRQLLESCGVPMRGIVAEHRFHDTRRWRFDFAYPDKLLAIEIEGGAYTNGRHTRGVGFVKDMEKYNHAALLGWRLLRFTPNDLKNKPDYVRAMISGCLRGAGG